jgi:hypothetical protein
MITQSVTIKGSEFFSSVNIGSGAQPASFPMGTEGKASGA